MVILQVTNFSTALPYEMAGPPRNCKEEKCIKGAEHSRVALSNLCANQTHDPNHDSELILKHQVQLKSKI
jgi:hypothetical protein